MMQNMQPKQARRTLLRRIFGVGARARSSRPARKLMLAALVLAVATFGVVPAVATAQQDCAGLSSFLCEVVVHVVGSRRPGKVMANALSACFHPWVPVPSSPPLLFPMLRIAK